MDESGSRSAIDALNSVIETLGALDPSDRQRVLHATFTFFSADTPSNADPRPASHRSSTLSRPSFTRDFNPSPKDFMLEKQPRTDVERVACIAYYLTHYRDSPHFANIDLSKLNTEAAQPKFSNIAYSANNATNQGYLAAAAKGQRQLSAAGEQFVRALPDRDAAKNAMSLARPRRAPKKKSRVTVEDNA